MKNGQWWDVSWNPITGCSPISEGCAHCWAKKMAHRLKGRFGYPKNDPFKVTFHPERLEDPLKWKKPKRIFVCDMGDLFHEHTGIEWFEDILSIIKRCPQHIFLILTKRPEGLQEYLENIDYRFYYWPFENIQLGVSVENQPTADERIPILLKISSSHYFVSHEPGLEMIDYPKEFLALGKRVWLITGGETGSKARPMYPDIPRHDRNQCQKAGVPFFFKAWGSYMPIGCALKGNPWHDAGYDFKENNGGRLLDGREYNEMP